MPAPFRSSMKFRTNAQKKRIDVWLIYRCDRCDETWNLPILERVAIGDLAPDRFEAFARNDGALAALYAFDHARLARHANRLEECTDADVAWSTDGAPPPEIAEIEILIRLMMPWRARLDRVAARQLGLPRSRLQALHAERRLSIAPPTRNPLRNAISDGQRLMLRLPGDLSGTLLVAALRGHIVP